MTSYYSRSPAAAAALLAAIRRNSIPDVQQILQENPAVASQLASSGSVATDSPIHAAGAVGSSAIIMTLVKYGANINRILPRTPGETGGCTCMDLAWEGRHVDAMNVVRQCGGFLRSEMPSMPLETGAPAAAATAPGACPAQAGAQGQPGYATAAAGAPTYAPSAAAPAAGVSYNAAPAVSGYSSYAPAGGAPGHSSGYPTATQQYSSYPATSQPGAATQYATQPSAAGYAPAAATPGAAGAAPAGLGGAGGYYAPGQQGGQQGAGSGYGYAGYNATGPSQAAHTGAGGYPGSAQGYTQQAAGGQYAPAGQAQAPQGYGSYPGAAPSQGYNTQQGYSQQGYTQQGRGGTAGGAYGQQAPPAGTYPAPSAQPGQYPPQSYGQYPAMQTRPGAPEVAPPPRSGYGAQMTTTSSTPGYNTASAQPGPPPRPDTYGSAQGYSYGGQPGSAAAARPGQWQGHQGGQGWGGAWGGSAPGATPTVPPPSAGPGTAGRGYPGAAPAPAMQPPPPRTPPGAAPAPAYGRPGVAAMGDGSMHPSHPNTHAPMGASAAGPPNLGPGLIMARPSGQPPAPAAAPGSVGGMGMATGVDASGMGGMGAMGNMGAMGGMGSMGGLDAMGNAMGVGMGGMNMGGMMGGGMGMGIGRGRGMGVAPAMAGVMGAPMGMGMGMGMGDGVGGGFTIPRDPHSVRKALHKAASAGNVGELKALLLSPLVTLSDVGPSLLHTAASFGNVQTVVELLGMGVPVNCVMGGKTPLDVARAAGYTTTARAIENRGGRPAEEVEPGAVAAESRKRPHSDVPPPVPKKPRPGAPPPDPAPPPGSSFMAKARQACAAGDFGTVLRLIDKDRWVPRRDFEMMDGKMTADQDPLFAAVAAGRVDVVEAFLASGVSADHRAKDPEAADITHTPLGFARLRAKSSPEMLDLLSSRGGHGSAADADKPHRQRLLLLAAKHDDPETAAECIQYGAVPQGSKANATLSPIHAASMAGSVRVAELLCKESGMVGEGGWASNALHAPIAGFAGVLECTALDLALLCGHTDVAELLFKHKVSHNPSLDTWVFRDKPGGKGGGGKGDDGKGDRLHDDVRRGMRRHL